MNRFLSICLGVLTLALLLPVPVLELVIGNTYQYQSLTCVVSPKIWFNLDGFIGLVLFSCMLTVAARFPDLMSIDGNLEVSSALPAILLPTIIAWIVSIGLLLCSPFSGIGNCIEMEMDSVQSSHQSVREGSSHENTLYEINMMQRTFYIVLASRLVFLCVVSFPTYARFIVRQ